MARWLARGVALGQGSREGEGSRVNKRRVIFKVIESRSSRMLVT
jgi:hypothetical protein